jgi:hypothetical protein
MRSADSRIAPLTGDSSSGALLQRVAYPLLNMGHGRNLSSIHSFDHPPPSSSLLSMRIDMMPPPRPSPFADAAPSRLDALTTSKPRCHHSLQLSCDSPVRHAADHHYMFNTQCY